MVLVDVVAGALFGLSGARMREEARTRLVCRVLDYEVRRIVARNAVTAPRQLSADLF
jgi:hypothetical protein